MAMLAMHKCLQILQIDRNQNHSTEHKFSVRFSKPDKTVIYYQYNATC